MKFFKSFPRGIKYYLFSILSVIYGIFLKTELFITRNLFTLFVLKLFKKKAVIDQDITIKGIANAYKELI